LICAHGPRPHPFDCPSIYRASARSAAATPPSLAGGRATCAAGRSGRLPLELARTRSSPRLSPPCAMDAGECSTSTKPPQPLAASPPSPSVWVRLGTAGQPPPPLLLHGFLHLHGFLILFFWFGCPIRDYLAVPADSACPVVEVAEDDSVVCSLVAPPACGGGGEEVAWCEIRRNAGDASSATIRNLRCSIPACADCVDAVFVFLRIL